MELSFSSEPSGSIASPKYLRSLNDRQREGVFATEGPVLVVAGAGSGKTSMLTSRIVRLILEEGVAPQNILAVTFTNKAAQEMRERIHRTLGDAAHDPHGFLRPGFSNEAFFSQPAIGTFHSICTRILRREMDRTPFQKPFVIYDDGDQLSLVKDCFNQLGISDKSYSPKSFQWSINTAKCAALEPHEIQHSEHNVYAKQFTKVYELYQRELFRSNALDFGEIITMTWRLLRDNADVLERYQSHFKFIHVDEYQDTNRAQYLLVKLLAAKHRNLFVVGDEDQSIYRWRGADIRNILDFEKDYPEAQVIKLEQNYRSTQTIIKASSHVIANNTERKAKTLWTANEEGSLIEVVQVTDDRAEAETVVDKIRSECAAGGFSFGDVAVFYRTNAQSRVLEDVLRRYRVPYRIVGGLRFFDRKEIKDVIAYLRILVNPTDSVSYKRVINVPQRSIGKATVEKVELIATQHGLSFEAAVQKTCDEDLLSGAPRRKLGEFLGLLEELRRIAQSRTFSEFYHELLDRTGYVRELKQENTDESLSRIENLQEFDTMLAEFEASVGATEEKTPLAMELIPHFLENITLVGEQDAQLDPSASAVSLMTLHTSKGLEFPLVFMVGLEEGLFPSIRPGEVETEAEIEEERRLCYVGMTRARKKLWMTHAVCRRVYGNIVYHDPARFLTELPKELVSVTDLARFGGAGKQRSFREAHEDYEDDVVVRPRSLSVAPASINGIGVGVRVRHGIYGIGIVRELEGTTVDSKVTIEFSGRQVRKFIVKYANLEVVG